jgi:hypothetical protein
MKEEDLEEIIRIDETTFKRLEPRSIENLSALRNLIRRVVLFYGMKVKL